MNLCSSDDNLAQRQKAALEFAFDLEEQVPRYVVFCLDESGSMHDPKNATDGIDSNGNPCKKKRWEVLDDAMQEAMHYFVGADDNLAVIQFGGGSLKKKEDW